MLVIGQGDEDVGGTQRQILRRRVRADKEATKNSREKDGKRPGLADIDHGPSIDVGCHERHDWKVVPFPKANLENSATVASPDPPQFPAVAPGS
jgi:hypothetical protein